MFQKDCYIGFIFKKLFPELLFDHMVRYKTDYYLVLFKMCGCEDMHYYEDWIIAISLWCDTDYNDEKIYSIEYYVKIDEEYSN